MTDRRLAGCTRPLVRRADWRERVASCPAVAGGACRSREPPGRKVDRIEIGPPAWIRTRAARCRCVGGSPWPRIVGQRSMTFRMAFARAEDKPAGDGRRIEARRVRRRIKARWTAGLENAPGSAPAGARASGQNPPSMPFAPLTRLPCEAGKPWRRARVAEARTVAHALNPRFVLSVLQRNLRSASPDWFD